MSVERTTAEAVHNALSNGIAIGVAGESSLTRHAPFTLFPSPVPRTSFQQAWDLATCFGTLVHRVASDPLWLIQALSSASESDAFTNGLLDILRQTTDPSDGSPLFSPWSLGLHRSDYMLHLNNGPENFDEVKLTQVEINTIASSFPMLSNRMSKFHHHTITWLNENAIAPTANSWNQDKQKNWEESRLPANNTPQEYAQTIALAHSTFLSSHGPSFEGRRVIAIFLVQDKERNFIDQRALEYEVKSLGVTMIRRSLSELAPSLSVDPASRSLLYSEGPSSGIVDAVVSVIYFRAAYTPADFPSDAEWATRTLIEKSTAIKCPTIAYHLAGTKKVQQLLADPATLGRFVGDLPEVMEKLQKCFTGLYEIDKSSEVFRRALESPHNFVMKPQREGGGNLIFGDKVKEALLSFSDSTLSAYILMDRIHPRPFKTWLVSNATPHLVESVSELGIYIGFLGDHKQNVLLNKPLGFLLRTKPESEADGGVAAGVASLDSVYLTD